jgi:hypothetical protein
MCVLRRRGWVAQLVEQRTENPCVGGSIPPPATIFGNVAKVSFPSANLPINTQVLNAIQVVQFAISVSALPVSKQNPTRKPEAH